MAALVVAAVLAPTPACAAEEFLLGGIQVNEPDLEHWAATLDDIGMNTVSVTVYAKQGDWDTDHLWWEDEEPAVLNEIRAAKARGLKVVLILRVALDHAFERNRFFWHGMIMPRTDAMIDSWFRQYTEFALKWAEVAQDEGVDLFGVGSEMKALSATLPIQSVGNLSNYYGFTIYQKRLRKRGLRYAREIEARDIELQFRDAYDTMRSYLDDRRQRNAAWAKQAYLRKGPRTLERINERRRRIDGHWLELIAAVREVYDGRLTYAANFDNYRNVGFFDELDVMGINGYFELRSYVDREPGEPELRETFRRRWRHVFDEVRQFRARHDLGDKPFIFTELGYTRRKNSTVEPWNHKGFSVLGKPGKRRLIVWREQPIDESERRICMDVLREVHEEQGRDLLGGILYWKLSTLRRHLEIEPFMLLVGPESSDGLQEALVRFVRPQASSQSASAASEPTSASGTASLDGGEPERLTQIEGIPSSAHGVTSWK
jgi:hypothetical protein